MSQLWRNYFAVCALKSFQQGHLGKSEGHYWFPAQGLTGRIYENQILHGSNSHPLNYCGTVPWVKFLLVYQLCWLGEGTRQWIGCSAGLFTVPFPFLAALKLSHDNDNKAEKEWNPVDIMVPVTCRWPGFCWWSGVSFPEPSTNAGQDN